MADTDPAAPQGKRRFAALLPLVLALGMGVLFYAMLGRDLDTLPSALIAKPVPQMDLPNLAGGPSLTTATLHEPGVKIVNIWASWCPPCRVEHPKLMELAALGVPVYGINYKDDPEKARKFLSDHGDPFTIVGMDEKGRMGIEWGAYGVPETYVVDGEGRIAYKLVGPILNDDLQTKILPAMRKAGWQG